MSDEEAIIQIKVNPKRKPDAYFAGYFRDVSQRVRDALEHLIWQHGLRSESIIIPQLHIANSPIAQCEYFDIGSSGHIIINKYDLEQLYEMWLTPYKGLSGPETDLMFARILGQRALSAGKILTAAQCGAIWRYFGPPKPHARYVRPDWNSSLMAFVLAHELAHYCIHKYPEIAEFFYELVQVCTNGFLADPRLVDREHRIAGLQNYVRATVMSAQRTHPATTNAQAQELGDALFAHLSAQIDSDDTYNPSSFLSVFDNRPRDLEEAVCDAIAAVVVQRTYTGQTVWKIDGQDITAPIKHIYVVANQYSRVLEASRILDLILDREELLNLEEWDANVTSRSIDTQLSSLRVRIMTIFSEVQVRTFESASPGLTAAFHAEDSESEITYSAMLTTPLQMGSFLELLSRYGGLPEVIRIRDEWAAMGETAIEALLNPQVGLNARRM